MIMGNPAGTIAAWAWLLMVTGGIGYGYWVNRWLGKIYACWVNLRICTGTTVELILVVSYGQWSTTFKPVDPALLVPMDGPGSASLPSFTSWLSSEASVTNHCGASGLVLPGKNTWNVRPLNTICRSLLHKAYPLISWILIAWILMRPLLKASNRNAHSWKLRCGNR